MKKFAQGAKLRAFGALRTLAEMVEIVLGVFALICLLFYPSLKTNAKIDLSSSGDKLILSGSELALGPVRGVRAQTTSTAFQQVYEVPFVESADLTIVDEDLTSTFTAEVMELVEITDREHVSAALDENGFLVVYDSAETLTINGDLPVFVVPVNEGSSGYVFGFAPASE